MPGKRWTVEQLRLLSELYPQNPTPEVARLIGKSGNCVLKMAQSMGIKKSPSFISGQKKLLAMSASPAAIANRFKPVHGMSNDKCAGSTYNAWTSMIARCTNRAHKSYAKYGGSGVSICDRWRHDFSAFMKDMGQRPNGTTLDRWPNGSGNYEPGNCRWATPREQARNRKTSIKLTAFGRTALMIEFADEFGIRCDTLMWRIRRLGMTAESALSTPVGSMRLPVAQSLEAKP